MLKYLYSIVLICCSLYLNAGNCPTHSDGILKGYILDGQQHVLKINEGTKGKAYFTFFEGFNYRFVVCSDVVKDFKVSVFDVEKNLIYSKWCNDYLSVIDMKFNSNIAGYLLIEVGEIKQNINTFTFRLTIGIKEDKAKK